MKKTPQPPVPSDETLREKAKEIYASPGEIEFDEEATVSRGSDAGAYVQAWVWVDF